MLGTSFSEYVFIRIAIFLLRFSPLLLAIALVIVLITDHEAHGLTIFLEVVAIAEFFFYVIVYIPRSRWLQAPAIHPPVLSKSERQKLFDKGVETIHDVESYISLWFNRAALMDIRREDMKQFFAWAFLNSAFYGPEDEDELEAYTNAMEDLLQRKLAPGHGRAKPIRLTIDPIYMQHRPLIWYLIVAAVDNVVSARLLFDRFQYFRLPASQVLSTFPFRPLTLLSRHVTPSGSLSYWYRPHTSRTRLPVLFIHGIGIGLYPYTRFLSDINSQLPPDDGQIGIIALELPSISSRITSAMPKSSTMLREILTILAAHNITSFVLAAHSYGTVIASQLLHHPTTARLISSSVFIDPVCFLLHEPHIAYNFTRRPPRRANEWQLHYFSSTDPMIAHELGRHFFWAENALWKEELRGRNVTVVLSGQDLIVDTLAVGRYLAAEADGSGQGEGFSSFAIDDDDVGANEENAEVDSWKNMEWKGEGLDLVWLEGVDHSRVFETRSGNARMAGIVRAYCAGD